MNNNGELKTFLCIQIDVTSMTLQYHPEQFLDIQYEIELDNKTFEYEFFPFDLIASVG